MTPIHTVTEILIKARALIATGWIQGNYEKIIDDVPCYCLTGAMREAGKGEKYNFRELSYGCILKVIEAKLDKPPLQATFRLSSFNDDPGMTQGKILQIFDDAIAISRIYL